MTLCGERYDKHKEEEEHILIESMPHSFVDSIFFSALRHELEVFHFLQNLELCL